MDETGLKATLKFFFCNFSQKKPFLDYEKSVKHFDQLLQIAKDVFEPTGETGTEIVLSKMEDELQSRHLAKEDLQNLMSLFSYVTGTGNGQRASSVVEIF
eukprot:Gregarina_sp_Poly_1__6207@NODE_328_length_9480_cov_62_396048_g50_i1_p8_GENE_NODE_328_length_9480_cov_62_396048_g50_i1NODE_328_length_9480_cov_62_396048_g50_i1_p8_ORF_typecomplete_len100_score22_47_NODE_328_length_9480_cov_62_396048_g50_i159216220